MTKLTDEIVKETINDMRRIRQTGWANMVTKLWFDNGRLRMRVEELRCSNLQLIASQQTKPERLTEYLDAAPPKLKQIRKVERATNKYMKELHDAQKE